MAPVVVQIEYCGEWGYEVNYEGLKKVILSAVPHAEVSGFDRRLSAFEITLNGNLIHSKLNTTDKCDKFPDNDEIVAMIKKEAEATK